MYRFIIIGLIVVLGLSACSDGPSSKAEAPLQADIRLVYDITRIGFGKTLEDTVQMDFYQQPEGDFEYVKTISSRIGLRETARHRVDSFFKYDTVSEILVEGEHLWEDPRKMARNDMGDSIKVSEVSWHDQDVYLLTDYRKRYYEKATGILVGVEYTTKKKKVKVSIYQSGRELL